MASNVTLLADERCQSQKREFLLLLLFSAFTLYFTIISLNLILQFKIDKNVYKLKINKLNADIQKISLS